jgi:tight adherence protein B
MSSQLISVLAALMMFGAASLVYVGYRQFNARASSPEMEDRLDRYASVSVEATTEPSQRVGSELTERIDRAVKNKTFGEQTMMALARADLRMTVGEFVAVRALSATVGFLIGLLLGRAQLGVAVLIAVALAAVAWMLPAMYLNFRAKRRKKAFVNQLGDTIGLMANSLRAGYSLLQTMELISRETPDPIGAEFKRVVREVGLGISPQQALANLLRRVPSEDLDLMVSAISIQHEIGGNLGQILDIIGETIRERVRIQGEISVLTAQQQLSGNVIAGLPFVLFVGLYLLNPSYMRGVFVMPWICIPIGAVVLIFFGYLAMRKICAIEV